MWSRGFWPRMVNFFRQMIFVTYRIPTTSVGIVRMFLVKPRSTVRPRGSEV